MYRHRLNLPAIASALREVQAAFPAINARLQMRRDVMSDLVVANMLAGYDFVDRLLGDGVDAFALGRLNLLLELNHLVLCGPDPEERRRAHRHVEATEAAFYDDDRGGVRDVREWYERNRGASVWKRAAGVYVRILTEPQLYIEGNHRAGALIVSYLLAREGAPPFVLTADNAEAYFRPSTLIRRTRKHGATALWRIPHLIGTFADYLQAAARPDLLLDTAGRPGAGPRAAAGKR